HKILNYYELANYPNNNFTFRKVLYYEKIAQAVVGKLLTTCIGEKKSISNIDDENVKNILTKAENVRKIIDSKEPIEKKSESLKTYIEITDVDRLRHDLQRNASDKESEHQEEEQAELEEIEVKKMSAVELMTIVGSKGLSAEHIIAIGFDDVNMRRVTQN